MRKIWITHSFRVRFDKDFKRHALDISDLVRVLWYTQLIDLSYPLKKLKANIKGIALRGIVMVEYKWVFVPLLIVRKSDKLWWENLYLDKNMRKKVHQLLLQIEKDIIHDLYTVYDI